MDKNKIPTEESNFENDALSLVEKARAKLGEGVKEVDGVITVNGEAFDSDTHILEDDGLPAINARGGLKRKRGKKRAEASEYKRVSAPKRKSTGKKKQSNESQIASEQTVAALQLLNIRIFGAHAKMDEQTKAASEEVLTELFDKHGTINVPVELRAGLVLGTYQIGVMTAPESKERIDSFKNKVMNKSLENSGFVGKIVSKFRKKKKNVENKIPEKAKPAEPARVENVCDHTEQTSGDAGDQTPEA